VRSGRPGNYLKEVNQPLRAADSSIMAAKSRSLALQLVLPAKAIDWYHRFLLSWNTTRCIWGKASHPSGQAFEKESIVRQLIFAAIGSVSLLGFLAPNPGQAQVLRPVGTGPVSPYLNLLRPGIPPAINYYGTVRPQLSYNAAINSLEQQVQASRVAATAAEQSTVPQTGHPITFLNYQRYFLNTGASSPFQNVQASQRAIGAGSLPIGSGVGTPGTRSAGSYGLGSIGSVGSLGAGAFRRY
jgi:hypothetical protein